MQDPTQDAAPAGTPQPVPPVEPPWWTPAKTGRARRGLGRAAIVEVALRVLRAEGIDAVSMRRVAGELDTGPASLYAHVAHKDELLELVFDAVAGEIPLPEPDPARWREQITRLWTDSHAVLARNGDIARITLGRVPLGPNALRVAEVSLAILRGGGVPDQAAAWALDVVGLYIAANAVEGAVHADLAGGGRDPMAYYRGVHDHFAGLPADRFPMIAATLPALLSGDGEQRFAFGLELLVGGLAALAERSGSGRS